eukprot:EG_transcript_26976
MLGSGGDICDLANLLSQNQESGSPPAPISPAGGGPFATPGSIGPPVKAVPEEPPAPGKNAIWTPAEVARTAGWNDPSDTRKRPEFTIKYKQQVGASDVYLGLDWEKDPSSMRCEDIIIDVHLPGSKGPSEFQLDVKEEFVDLRSKLYKLMLPLERKVYANKGSAKWDGKTETLRITLPIDYSGYASKIIV